MNVSPKGAPAPASTPAQQPQSARERAIAKLTTGQSPVPIDQNNVSVEELGAASVQKDTSESRELPKTEVTAPVTTKPEEPLSSQYAVLARKEKALRAKAQAQEQQLKQRELELAAREEAIKAKDVEYASKYVPKDSLTNPETSIQTLLDAGLTYEQITERMLNQPNPQEQSLIAYQRKIDAKLKAIEDAQERAQKDYQTNQQQQYEQAVSQITLEAKQLVAGDPETYEAIKTTGSVRDVVKLIERTFKEDGVLMSVEDAAAEVEEYLTEEATKLSRLNKIQRLLNASKQTSTKTPSQAPTQQKQPQMKTLSNAVGTSGKLSQRDRAILAFKGELKN